MEFMDKISGYSKQSSKEVTEVICRNIVAGHEKDIYTEKGMAVQRILVEIASFSAKYEPEIIFVDEKPRNNGKPLFGTGNLSEVYNY